MPLHAGNINYNWEYIIKLSNCVSLMKMVAWISSRGGRGGGWVVSYPDPDSHSCGWITSPLRSGDVIHPQLWESGSGYETRGWGRILNFGKGGV